MDREINPSRVLEAFLDYVSDCEKEYHEAKKEVEQEDARLTDLVHEMEFAADKKERNRVATRLQQSRKRRRDCKDRMQRNELIAKFICDPKNREILKRIRGLIGQQKKKEEYLEGPRTYHPRVQEAETNGSN